MTNTTPEAVERLSWSPTDMVQMNGHGSYVYYADYAAISAQLEAANARAARARDDALVEALERIEELEAKLHKAVGALGDIGDGEPEWPNDPQKELDWCRSRANKALAKLKEPKP